MNFNGNPGLDDILAWRKRNPGLKCDCGTCVLVDGIEELVNVLRGETEQHEAFYIQSGTKSDVQEAGIAGAKSLLARYEKGTDRARL